MLITCFTFLDVPEHGFFKHELQKEASHNRVNYSLDSVDIDRAVRAPKQSIVVDNVCKHEILHTNGLQKFKSTWTMLRYSFYFLFFLSL